MLDPLNLDQLRVFVAIVEHGSFSAAARKLGRAQSAVSNAIVNLEEALGVTLFDRSGWKPQITVQGETLLADAQAVLARTDQFKARARGLTQGLEAELALVIDVMFPVDRLVDLAGRFQQAFPGVLLRLRTEVLGGVPEMVLEGGYDLGVQGSLPDIAPGLASYALQEIALVPVAAPAHPLSGRASIENEVLRAHTQVVLTDSTGRTQGNNFSVFATHRILTADLGSKHAMLRAGLGWGFMPLTVVAEDVGSARLVELDLRERRPRNRKLPLFMIHQRGRVHGPAATWMMNALVHQATQDAQTDADRVIDR